MENLRRRTMKQVDVESVRLEAAQTALGSIREVGPRKVLGSIPARAFFRSLRVAFSEPARGARTFLRGWMARQRKGKYCPALVTMVTLPPLRPEGPPRIRSLSPWP